MSKAEAQNEAAQNEEPRNEAEATVGENKPVAVVEIEASAGGIKALQEFFDGIPADSGLAFVVAMHLSPSYESGLAQVIQSRTPFICAPWNNSPDCLGKSTSRTVPRISRTMR